MRNTLISKDSKGKIRVVEISCEGSELSGFTIKRNTYQYQGKVTAQPDITITKGKVKRTVTQQAELEYNSHLKKYQDKGYKLIEGEIEDYTKAQLDEILPEHKTDANGCKKHMLAKDFNKVATSVYDKVKVWLASRKIDGVRCSFYFKDGEVHSSSRGGGDYDPATVHIRNNPALVEWFKNHPDVSIDGELYSHGRPLQWISGTARLEQDDPRTLELEFWMYDIMDAEADFTQRNEQMLEMAEELNITSDLFTPILTKDLQIRLVPQEEVSGWTNIKKLHDKYVGEGFEGVVIRNPSKLYGFGKRTNDMIKIKEYQDAEFEITGISEGLRDEDMCFTCITEDGIEFKAKPMGSRELKQEYRDNLDDIIGKMATVKFFYYSEEGTPLQPVLKCIRDYE